MLRLYLRGVTNEPEMYEELLRALRRAPDRSLNELADAVGLPRTNFGRPLGHRLQEPVERLVGDGLVEEDHGRYRLSEFGRRTLAQRALDSEGHASHA